MADKQKRLIDIAMETGVSKASVAAVLSPSYHGTIKVGAATREKILTAAKRMNYHPNITARVLAGAASKVLGVLIDSRSPLVRFRFLAAIEREAARRDYRCMIGEAHDSIRNLRENYDLFMRYGVDGVICISHRYPGMEQEFAELFSDCAHNMVFLGNPGLPDASYLEIERGKVIFEAIGHLRERGSKRIAMIESEDPWDSTLQRKAGYFEAVRTWDLPPLYFSYRNFDDFIGPFLAETVKRDGIDALIAQSDHAAIQILQILHDSGVRCPDSIRLVGNDNDEYSRYTIPALTTIDETCEENAREVVSTLLKKITHPGEKHTGCFSKTTPKLIIRRST